jgi:hypothetical protein
LLLCQESYQEIDDNQQKLIKENYFKYSQDSHKLSTINNIPPQLINLLKEKLNEKLKLKLGENTLINNNLNLWLERFFHQYFNRL